MKYSKQKQYVRCLRSNTCIYKAGQRYRIQCILNESYFQMNDGQSYTFKGKGLAFELIEPEIYYEIY
jgi:hypothetical protein